MSKKKNKNSNKSQYKTIYTQQDYQRDADAFNKSLESENPNNVDFSAFQRLMLRDICINTKIIETGYIGDVKLSDLEKALRSPRSNWRMLLSASEQLMRVSPFYYKLNSYYSNMPLFCWGLDLYDVRENANMDSVKKTYLALAAKLEGMNLKHEFSKITKVLPYQDIYCGLLFENQYDFFIQQIHFSVCQIYEIQDGLYNFVIDLSKIKPQTINAYPDYIQKAWLDYKDGKIDCLYKPPAEKQVCFKFNSQWTYPYPLLIGLVRDILDLDIYKKLKLQSARNDNYKAIAVKVPIDESQIDKPLLTPDTLGIFAEINRESMSDDVGLIHTLGSDATVISFKDSNNTRNNVSDAVDSIYDTSGVSREMFNGSSAGTAVQMSVENDSAFIYGLYRQFERWVNRYIKLKKYNKSAFKFSFYLVDITVFNRDNVVKRYRENATLGLPIVDKLLATLDMTPSRVMGAYVTHNEIFDYYNKFKPLTSSYNGVVTTGNEGAGRPTAESKNETLSESGEKTKDLDSNAGR